MPKLKKIGHFQYQSQHFNFTLNLFVRVILKLLLVAGIKKLVKVTIFYFYGKYILLKIVLLGDFCAQECVNSKSSQICSLDFSDIFCVDRYQKKSKNNFFKKTSIMPEEPFFERVADFTWKNFRN